MATVLCMCLQKGDSELSSHSGKAVEDPALHIGKTHRPTPVLCLAVAHTETGLTGFEISLQFYTQVPKIRDELFKAVRFLGLEP